MVHRQRHLLLAVISLVTGTIVTWLLSVTGTDADFFRSLLYPWMCAAVLLLAVILGATTSVKGAVVTLVPFLIPQPFLAIWRGFTPQHDPDNLWLVGFLTSTTLLVFSVGCIAIGICIRLMFRR